MGYALYINEYQRAGVRPRPERCNILRAGSGPLIRF